MASSNAVGLFSRAVLGIPDCGENFSASGGVMSAPAAADLAPAFIGIAPSGWAEGPPDTELAIAGGMPLPAATT